MARPRKRRKATVFSALALALIALSALALFRRHERVVTVQVEKVTRRNLTELVTANGTIQPVLEVKISPEVSGEIIELPVKEGQHVRKGDLILKIRPDFYVAQRNQAQASYQSSLAAKEEAEANLRKAEAEFKRNEDLYQNKLVSDSVFDGVRAAYDVAKAQLASAVDEVEMSRANLDSAEDSLEKTTIVSPLTGTISRLNSRVGERVVGTATMAGTEVMTIADLNEMEARVDVGEVDVVLIKPGQHVHLAVDAFKDRKFSGTVTEIADSPTSSGASSGSTAQEATQFQVKVRIEQKEAFLPGMSVTAEVETRSRTNVLTVPIASVTTRPPKQKHNEKGASGFNRTNSVLKTNGPAADGTGDADEDKPAKPIDVVFVVQDGRAEMQPVKIGISDDNYWEITDGLKEGQEVVSGGYRAISRDLEDGTMVRVRPPPGRH